MNKRFKQFVTIAASAAMLLGSTMPAFADEPSEQTGTGTATYEGYVDETSAFKVVVPTAAADAFNFTVDPNGLLKGTDYARMLSNDVTAANFDGDAKLYFANSHKVNDVDTLYYTDESKSITMINKSSYEVNVEVTASITGAEGITLADEAPDDSAEDPTLYMAIITDEEGKETTPIVAEGGTYSSTIEGEPDNFMIRYYDPDGDDPAGYYYVERTDTDTEQNYNANGDVVAEGGTAGTALADWKDVTFYLTGTCGGAWTDDQAALQMGVSLTWKITDPEAVPETYTVTYNANYVAEGEDAAATATAAIANDAHPTGADNAEVTALKTREGYTFKFWGATANATEAATLDDISASTTLYAIWEESITDEAATLIYFDGNNSFYLGSSASAGLVDNAITTSDVVSATMKVGDDGEEVDISSKIFVENDNGYWVAIIFDDAAELGVPDTTGKYIMTVQIGNVRYTGSLDF